MERPNRGNFHSGTSWQLPELRRQYPLRRNVVGDGRLVLRLDAGAMPGADVAISVMAPMPTEWWLRPVSNAWRVGEAQCSGVGNRVSLRPSAAKPFGDRGVARAAERGYSGTDVVGARSGCSARPRAAAAF